MHNAVMCTLRLYDVIGITRHLLVKLKSFSKIAQPLHKEAVHDCTFLYIIAKRSVIMSEAFFVDVSVDRWIFKVGKGVGHSLGPMHIFAVGHSLGPMYTKK